MPYESDITLFLAETEGGASPTLEAEQRARPRHLVGRAAAGSRRRKQELESRVPQQAYAYQTQR